jgi:hypothetical protein
MEEIKTGIFKVKEDKPIFVIGDIHGDYQCLIHCLNDLCKVTITKTIINDTKFNEPQREILEWKENNDSVVIFCGDLIHRKRFQDTILDDECSDIFIIKTLLRLKTTAQKYSGDILIISGNHEIMNIIDPTDTMYTSDKNILTNQKYFNSTTFLNNYIQNTFAWIKLNDILIAHGGLCSDYLKFLENENEYSKLQYSNTKSKPNHNNHNQDNNVGGSKIFFEKIMIGGNLLNDGDEIVEFVNNKYRSFFTNYNKEKEKEKVKSKLDPIGFKLFIEYDFKNKHKHNMFWCREWGYSGINCNNFNNVLNKITCNKMIIAHCPQFLSYKKPKMINFECLENYEEIKKLNVSSNNINFNDKSSDNLLKEFEKIEKKYKIARVDLGMSRSFEYNKTDEFIKFLSYNYNRKISILKLSWDNVSKNYYFNYNSVLTEKLSCIQYLLIKYGITKKEWEDKNINSNWLGFNYIDNIIEKSKKLEQNDLNKKCNSNNIEDALICLLYPVNFASKDLESVIQFNKLIK